jgi:hypothetical protein
MAAKWNLKGTYFEACNCKIACPCIFLEDPSLGYCQAFVAWHIDKGHLGETKLDGLNVAVWLHSPQNLIKGNWRIALYIDKKANKAQTESITELWSGKHGGHLAAIASFVSEIMGVKNVPIEFKEDGKHHHLVVSEVGEIDMEEVVGEGEGQVKIIGHPLAVSPGHPAVVSRSKRLRYQDYGVDWHHSGTNGYSAPFAYQP